VLVPGPQRLLLVLLQVLLVLQQVLLVVPPVALVGQLELLY
jgi:hypothetical protein